MVVVDEVLHADQEHVYSSRSFHREVLGIVPGKMEIYLTKGAFQPLMEVPISMFH